MRLPRACATASCAAILAGGMAATSLAASGAIHTVAGTGVAGSVHTGVAVTSQLNVPSDVAAMPDGGFLVTDTFNARIRAVSASGAVSTFATGFSPSAAAGLSAPAGLAAMPGGDVLVTDGHRVLRISNGAVTRVAGDASSGAGGDGGSALSARLSGPAGLAVLPSGGFVVADMGNHRIRKVKDGKITTVAGTGAAGFSGDGGAATDAQLRLPADVAVMADGDLLVADAGNGRVRRVDDATGAISTVAGGGTDAGEGVPATRAALPAPSSVTALAGGAVAISVAGSRRVRRLAADGTITTLAGTGEAGSGGDGGPATAATLHAPAGLAVTPGGRLLIADRSAHRVRAIDVGGEPVLDAGALPGEGSGGGNGAGAGDEPPGEDRPDGEEPAESRPDGDGPAGGRPATGDPSPGQAPAAPALQPTAPAPGADATVLPAGASTTATPAPAPPRLGRAVVVAPVSGTVLVRRPGARTATPLRAGEQIPVGSLLDTRRGTVALTSALAGGRTQTGRFSGGRFSVRQPAKERGMTELVLRGPELGACRRSSRPVASAAARRKPARRLWGQDKGGRFRTRGRNSVATVRGTRWLTQDTCAGTLTRVVEGAVDVTDLRRGVTRRVRAGRSLLVRAPGR